jgi:hypothetical protein
MDTFTTFMTGVGGGLVGSAIWQVLLAVWRRRARPKSATSHDPVGEGEPEAPDRRRQPDPPVDGESEALRRWVARGSADDLRTPVAPMDRRPDVTEREPAEEPADGLYLTRSMPDPRSLVDARRAPAEIATTRGVLSLPGPSLPAQIPSIATLQITRPGAPSELQALVNSTFLRSADETALAVDMHLAPGANVVWASAAELSADVAVTDPGSTLSAPLSPVPIPVRHGEFIQNGAYRLSVLLPGPHYRFEATHQPSSSYSTIATAVVYDAIAATRLDHRDEAADVAFSYAAGEINAADAGLRRATSRNRALGNQDTALIGLTPTGGLSVAGRLPVTLGYSRAADPGPSDLSPESTPQLRLSPGDQIWLRSADDTDWARSAHRFTVVEL